MKNYELDLVNGSLFKNIFLFSLPLMFSNVLQSLFNIVDISIVGKFAGTNAIGSVGSTTMYIWFFTGLINGIASAGNVLVAFYVGAKNQKEVREIIYNSFVFCLLSGIVFMILAISFAKPVFVLMHTKPELLHDAILYTVIYMLGLPACAIYNFGNAVLSAIGDTKRPVIYLGIAGIVNIILDLVLVCVFHMDVAGVALASYAAQWISAGFILAATIKGTGDVKLIFKGQKLNKTKIARLVKIGLPAGLQASIFSVANMFIQSGINSFDSITVAGCTAAEKGDGLNYNLMFAFYGAGAAFIGQNYGANKKDRVLKSYFISVGYAALTGFCFGLIMLFFGKNFLTIFTNNPNVISAGFQRLRIMAISYWISAFMDGTIAASRGLGKTSIPTVIVIIGSCVFRIIWIYTIFAYFKTIESLFLLYIFSWTITAFAEIIYFVRLYKKTFNSPRFSKAGLHS